MTVIVLSKLDLEKAQLAGQIAKLEKGSKIFLLSDATYLVKEKTALAAFRELMENGAQVLALNEDFIRRGIEPVNEVSLVNIEDFVDTIMIGVRIVNL